MSNYYYLIASLPMLHFGAKPPFLFEQFLRQCSDLIPAKDYAVLTLCGGDILLEEKQDFPLLKEWLRFETALRNELVKIRAVRRKVEAARYLRRDGYSETALYHIAMNSHRIAALIDSEKFLDQERWKKLDELSMGHYFDMEALVVYALKLNIILRWDKISGADKQKELERGLPAASRE
ncbi:MAG: DUF2764 family protein [Candidatus Omnitrophica bacterium]|nr:DUF2764 family protein [Candidatus Omnitrophota bacterium]